MNKDLKHGLAIGVAFASLVAFAMPAKAEDRLTDDEICEKSIRYSFKYMPEEDDAKLHQARWQIIEGDRADDLQKMVGLVVFDEEDGLNRIGQRRIDRLAVDDDFVVARMEFRMAVVDISVLGVELE